MGAMLSLPVIAYFLVPSLGTYSTSLNLLFFYMTWSTLVLSQPPLRVEVIGSLAVRVLLFLIPSLFFFFFDSVIPSLAGKFKRQGAVALPTRGSAPRSQRRPPWYKVMGLSLFNICLGIAFQVGVELLFTDVLGIRSALKVATTLPMPWSIAKDIGKGLLLREVIQYYSHGFLLHPRSPTTLSNLHKQYFHSITAPYSFAAHYDHPLPYLLFRFLPAYIPALVFRFHLLTYLLLLAIITLEETITMSGYSSILGIMVEGITRRQDMHSQSKGRGNFSPWGLMDWVHGTGIGPDVIDDMKDEAEKHSVKERGENMLSGAKESSKKGLRAMSDRRKSRSKAR